MLPLTIDRFRLLREIALRYPDLSRSQVENWLAKGIDVGQRLQEDVEIPPIAQLVNPEVMRTLRLGKEEGGPALLIHFTIAFSQWGCATPQLSVDPVVEDRGGCSLAKWPSLTVTDASHFFPLHHPPQIFTLTRKRC